MQQKCTSLSAICIRKSKWDLPCILCTYYSYSYPIYIIYHEYIYASRKMSCKNCSALLSQHNIHTKNNPQKVACYANRPECYGKRTQTQKPLQEVHYARLCVTRRNDNNDDDDDDDVDDENHTMRITIAIRKRLQFVVLECTCRLWQLCASKCNDARVHNIMQTSTNGRECFAQTRFQKRRRLQSGYANCVVRFRAAARNSGRHYGQCGACGHKLTPVRKTLHHTDTCSQVQSGNDDFN